ncbi:S49 family peptidase [Tsukamurella sp. 8J]|uniref:S49 family peptidase n=1 Tax=Tsukamurella sp. 8J TaxID=3031962 RepID=UPI0023B8FF72|nr:S49 family peptidase [Tsukamurella sp. 8J]MDF0532582.1 S49 family peptidase [Tsukamurella sp. 8J]
MTSLVTELQDVARTAGHRVRSALGQESGGVVPVVRLEGPIAAHGTGMGRTVLNHTQLEAVLTKAFETDDARAVALSINCPGGSPAQSEYLADRIRALAAEHELPVLAFCEDVAASGGYWLACAADEIHVAATSIVGSIGVVSAGFGAVDLLGKIGLERRVFTAGDAKHRLDMFEDVREQDVEWLHSIHSDLHSAFIGWVRERRGDRLVDDPALFTGEVWIGAKAVELGLADSVGRLRTVLAERFPDVEIKPVHTPKPLVARLMGGGAAAFGEAAAGALGAVAARAEWARFGV